MIDLTIRDLNKAIERKELSIRENEARIDWYFKQIKADQEGIKELEQFLEILKPHKKE